MPDPQGAGAAVRLAFAADPLSVRAALARLLAAPPLAGTSPDDRATVELVLAEVLNNVVEHAYAGRSGLVEVELVRATAGLACQVCDQGGPMPGEQVPFGRQVDPAGLALADLPEGGFGWSMIRSVTTGLTYGRVGGCNRLGFFIPLQA